MEKAREKVLKEQRTGVGEVERRLALDEALQLAMKNNLDIDIEKTNLANADSSLKAAKGVFDGVVLWTPGFETRNTPTPNTLFAANGKLTEHYTNMNFGYRQRTPWQGVQLGVAWDNQRQTTNNPFNALNPNYTSRLTFSLSAPLWRYANADLDRTLVKVRKRQVEQSKADFEARVINTITAAQNAYWDLAAAIEDAVVAADGVRLAQEQHDRNKRQVATGTLAPVEIAGSEAELQRRIDNYVSAIGLITIAENQLKTVMTPSRNDVMWDERIVPVDRDLKQPVTDSLKDAMTMALKKRPEIRSLQSRMEQNDDQKKLAMSATKPQVNLVAGYSNTGLAGTQLQNSGGGFASAFVPLFGRVNELSDIAGLPPLPPPNFGGGGVPPSFIGGPGQAISNMFSGNYQSIAAGLQIEWNPRNRTAEATVEQAVLAERRLKLSMSQLEQGITAEVRGSLQALETAKQRIEAARASERAAQEKLESEIRLFQTGESTNFLVLTRQNELIDSRRRTVGSALLLNKAVARLEQALGATLETHKIQLQP
jgi:HAE1 family hydrophobic/amphiphilic exporter-1